MAEARLFGDTTGDGKRSDLYAITSKDAAKLAIGKVLKIIIATALAAACSVFLYYVTGGLSSTSKIQQLNSTPGGETPGQSSGAQESNTGQASSGGQSKGSYNKSSTSITVNGQSINAPENGTYSQTFNTKEGQTTINGSNSTSSSVSSGGSHNSSSMTVNVRSP